MTCLELSNITARTLVKELEKRASAVGIVSLEDLQGAKQLAIALDERQFRVHNPNQQEMFGLEQPSLIRE